MVEEHQGFIDPKGCWSLSERMARTKKKEAGTGSREYRPSSMGQPGQRIVAEAAAV